VKQHRPTPPWLFVFTGTAYGVPGAFTAAAMPYLARRAGIDLDAIGWFVTLMFFPSVVQFLYAPIVDFGPKRKHWLVMVSLIGAVCLFIAFQMKLPDDKFWFLLFGFFAQLSSGFIGSCNGGLMATGLTDAQRGKAGGWLNVGNLAGAGLSGATAVYMSGHGFSTITVGATMAAMMVLPALVVLTVDEPPRVVSEKVGEAMKALLREVKRVLWTRAGITGLLLCLSPVGTAALANYFSGIAQDYVRHDVAGELAKLPVHQAEQVLDFVSALGRDYFPHGFGDWFAGFFIDASNRALDERVSSVLAFVGGPVGQGLTAFGALVGGFVCDRTNRRAMYLLSGVLTAVVGVVMAVSPASEATFTMGALTYALVTGFCYSAFTATVLETIGADTKSASTRYSLFTAAGNVAITYVGFVDSRFEAHHGVAGVVGSDAMLNIAGVVVLGLVFWRLGSFGKSRHVPEPESKLTPPEKPELPVAKIRE
jgi:MFS transporter, PAT family, beta-lactamase induction signal transducer AmpG